VIDDPQLKTLFSIVLKLDTGGRILEASETFERHISEFEQGCALLSLFKIVRPATVRSWSDVDGHINSLFLLTAYSGQFAIRGQVFKTASAENSYYIFCGSPWLTWISDHCPNTRMSISDFAPQDSQLDQLFLMTTEKRMVNDLERLNGALKKAKRETELAEEARAALFARMSHEMRTPLNGVISALSLLSHGNFDEESQEILRLAQSSSTNLLHVINYVLDMSKIESRALEAEEVLFNVQDLLESVTDIVRPAAEKGGLELRWEVDPSLARSYRGDKPKLRQCLINLASNAIKFTEKGKVIVRAFPSPRDKEGLKVRFEVEDTGIGISEKDRKRIFDPFWTGASNADRGTGLGLDIVRRAVDIMGGIVGVVSAPGAGSVFWLDIPLAASDKAEEGDEILQSTLYQPLPEREYLGRVLLVDDNETNLILGRKILETLGVQVHLARDGEDALAKCDTNHYQLVFMDISMPGMDGVHTTLKLRERFDDKALPVVALTAYASAEEEKRCLAAGMNHYLIKPIVREQLAEQLERFLEQATSDEPAQEAEAGPGEQPLLNAVTLDTLLEQIGPEGLSEVVNQFQKEARDRDGRFLQAASAGDADTAQREAHTLGSTCLSLGLDRAALAFRAAESALLDRSEGGFVASDAKHCSALLKQSVAQLKQRVQLS
jgi:signal transduction histidine kinase/CheY-like chemotaxis protein/HPt (histidine-containing phosphotransfer) domain-containing protein